MEQIVVITNPNAKRNRQTPDRKLRLSRVMAGLGPVFETAIPEDLQPVSDRIAKLDPRVIAVCGGDGTLQHCLTAFIRSYGGPIPAKILPLRGGTMCTTAQSVRIRGSAENVLGRMVAALLRGDELRVKRRAAIKVDQEYSFLFGAGLGSNYIDAYDAAPGDGPAAAAYVLFRGIFAGTLHDPQYRTRLFSRIQGRIEVNGAPVPFNDFSAVLMGTMPDVGIGFKIMYRGDQDETRFQIIATGLPPGRIVRNIPRMFLGRPIVGRPHHDALTSRVVMKMDRPFRYSLDGEMFTGQHLTASIGPVVEIALI